MGSSPSNVRDLKIITHKQSQFKLCAELNVSGPGDILAHTLLLKENSFSSTNPSRPTITGKRTKN